MEEEGEDKTEDEATGSESVISTNDSESIDEGEEGSGDDGEESVISEDSSDFVDQDVPGKSTTQSKLSHLGKF
jgi:hypothetical protein